MPLVFTWPQFYLPVTEVVVSDTAANMQGVFARHLVPDLPSHLRLGKCVCHVLQLAIGDCILKKPNIATILANCRFETSFNKSD